MTWILGNIRLIGILGAIIGLLCIGWHFGALNEKTRSESALKAQIESDNHECDNAKKTTKEANDALQEDRDRVSKRNAADKLQHPAACVQVSRQTKSASSGNEHAGQNGISSDWLRDYAAECEGYRSEVITLSKFIDAALAR